MCTHMRVLSKSYPMSTNMTGFKFSEKSSHPCTLDESSLSIGGVKSLGKAQNKIAMVDTS